MAAVIYPVGNSLTSSPLINLVSGICVGTVVYILMLLFLREIQKEEVQLLRGIGDKILRRIQNKQ